MRQVSNKNQALTKRPMGRSITGFDLAPWHSSKMRALVDGWEMEVAGRDPPTKQVAGQVTGRRSPTGSGLMWVGIGFGKVASGRMPNSTNKKLNLQQEGYREDLLP